MIKTKYLLALNAHEKIGSQTLKKIVFAFPDLEKIWNLGELAISQKLGDKIAKLVVEAREKYNPDLELEKLEKNNIGYITMYDKLYPANLAEIPDKPVILYIRGNVGVFKMPSISIVGSRKYTNYGQRIAKRLTESCVNSGLVVVSGLALGIDGIAHRSVLSAGGKTIAVLACGLDRVYPGAHIGLAREIIKDGGAIISEYPPGTQAFQYNFPQRNRIIAGLSLGTIVVEANEDSGSLITANCALDYNREVFAVPGPIDSPTSRGTIRLIQQGAKAVLDDSDIFAELPIEEKASQQRAKELLPENKEEQAILTLLEKGELPVDLLVRKSGLSIVCIAPALTMMEMKGMIENIGGGRYRKIS